MRTPDVSIPSNGEFSILLRYYPTLALEAGAFRYIWNAVVTNHLP